MKNSYRSKYTIWIILGVSALITIVRSFFSVDLTDESYIYAETYNVLKGSIPYVTNTSEQTGMCFVIIPFLYIYRLFQPQLEGVVIFLRLVFSILRIVVIGCVFSSLRRKHSEKAAILACAPLVVWYYFTNYFSYNSNCIWGLLLVTTWLYESHDEKLSKKKSVKLFASGLISAFCVFSHLVSAIAIVWNIVLLLVYSEKKQKIKTVWHYSLGGIVILVLVTGALLVKAGTRNLINGIRNMMNTINQISQDNSITWLVALLKTYKWLIFFILSSVLFALILKGIKKQTFDFGVVATASLCIGSMYNVCYSIYNGMDLMQMGAYIGIMITVWTVVLYCSTKSRALLFLSFPFTLWMIMVFVISRTANVGLHPSLAFPAIVGVVLCLSESSNCRISKLFLNLFVVIVFSLFLVGDILYVYRDSNINELNAVVKKGVYKGIYTTQQRANDLPLLEEFLYDETKDDEAVMFRDNVPFAYLMYKGYVCDAQSWDIMQYSYGWNKPRVIYNNFLIREQIPSKIIYVDFGRDEKLSIDSEEFSFNDFVNSYYEFTKEAQIGESFLVKIYSNSGVFDGDFSKWTNFKKF